MAAAPNASVTALHVAQHVSQDGSWRIASRAPDPRLAADVRRYNAYRESGTRFSRRRELPSGNVTLIVNLGSPLSVDHPEDTRSVFGPGAGFIAGLHETYAGTETAGAQEGVHIFLTPLGARRLLQRPLHELANRVVDLDTLLGSAARRLAAQLQETPDERARLDLLDAAMLERLAGAPPIAADLAWAWRMLDRSAGKIAIADLVATIGCSRKHLTTRFRDAFGLPPKALARILRFEAAVNRLQTDPATSLAALAQDCGYYDQAHLARDFRAFAGGPPSDFARRQLPDEGGVRDD
jgi:AraC-like DNA-binding protein